jgi:mRNA interferase YafQ
MRKVIETNQFRRDYKKIAASGQHATGEWKGYRECHIKPDWLLIYQKRNTELVLVRTGSRSELF